MADPDKSAKRLNLASNTVAQATAFWDAYTAMQELRAERAVAGNYAQDGTDFVGTDLAHLSGFLVGAFLDQVVAEIEAWFNEAGKEYRKGYFLELRR